jgi:hypothetical protein
MSTIQNLNAKRGDSLIFRITLTYLDTGLPVSLVGMTIWFTLKKNINDADSAAIIKKQFHNFSSPTLGIATLNCGTPTDTNNLLGKYFYDIQYKDSSGDVRSPDEGTINFTRDVTRTTSYSSSSSSSSRSSSSSSLSA